MKRKRILFVGGTRNQISMMHAVSRHLDSSVDSRFTYSYADGIMGAFVSSTRRTKGLLSWRFASEAMDYIQAHELSLDRGGLDGSYDLAVLGTDLIIPRNLRGTPLLLIQEGMTDPENWLFPLVKSLLLPRWAAGTAAFGLSGAYDRFCVASEGYRRLFIRRGAPADRIIVTGIPNFDNARELLQNDFPRCGYVLVATSDTRETFRFDDRKTFLGRVREIAGGRPVIFKLHPNENVRRSSREILRLFPEAAIFREGDAGPMIANCDALVTQYSSVVFLGLALGKECHSYFDTDELRELLPIQNGGTSAASIASVCLEILAKSKAA